MNITEPLRIRARASPNAPALVCTSGDPEEPPGGTLTYAELDRLVDAVARRTLASGIVPGSTAAIAFRTHFATLVLLLALARIGVVARVGETLDRVDVAFLRKPRPVPPGLRTIAIDPGWFTVPPPSSAPAPLDPAPGGGALCRILTTSGTTGVAKRIAATHDMLAARVAVFDRPGGPRPSTRLLCPQGPAGGFGFTHMLHRLSAGGVVILAKLKQDLAAVIDLHRAEWLAASPATLRGIVEGRRPGASRMRSLEVIEAVGSVMPAVLAGRVRSELCANLHANYGSTETGTVASGPLQDSADLPGGTSRLLGGVVVESLGDDERPLPRGSTGRLRVRTPGMAHRYEGDDAASERAFRNGWFLPGDLGAVTGDGILVVTGRIDDLINVGGNKISPQVIEDALLRVPGVTDAAAVGIRDASGCTGIGVAIVADDRATPAALDDACKRLRYMAPSRIVRLDELPRNENGKVDREDIARRM